ncbi:Transcription repressor OFP2 [Sesamum angolense]|uniref:Transcription repressor n=1 Tax=Sesamum angolense TaxID=2727404 RepID=A0AAE1X9B8_9LAMI|nr:Transcription repressor OFP2 [Sesamum angolense]
MGNHRFRLSDMMPNAWFYKLRDMSKSRAQNPTKKKLPSQPQNPRKSLYQESVRIEKFYGSSPKNPRFFDTQFPAQDPPRRSSKKRAKRKTIYMPSPGQIAPSVCIFQEAGKIDFFDSPTSPDGDFLESESEYDGPLHDQSVNEGLRSWSSSSCSCKLSSSATDIIIDVDDSSCGSIHIDRVTEFNMISEPDLPPILTKPVRRNPPEGSPKSKINYSSAELSRSKNTRTARTRKSVSRSGGVKIRGKKIETGGRKSVKSEKKGLFYSDSFAIVKASFDPERDFRDSMMEMIVENNIRASKDLEELLACYLSLNSNQYHSLIIKAFEQIWFNMPEPNF